VVLQPQQLAFNLGYGCVRLLRHNLGLQAINAGVLQPL